MKRYFNSIEAIYLFIFKYAVSCVATLKPNILFCYRDKIDRTDHYTRIGFRSENVPNCTIVFRH